MDASLLLTAGIVGAICACLGVWIASVKHRPGEEGCLLGCLLGPFGVLIEALLPSVPAPTPVAASPAELVRKCPDCAETIKAEAHVCRFCGVRFSDEEVAAAVARTREDQDFGLRAPVSDAPGSCRYCGRESTRNWYSARKRVCVDCYDRPEVRADLEQAQ